MRLHECGECGDDVAGDLLECEHCGADDLGPCCLAISDHDCVRASECDAAGEAA